jgi:hypothetical protein
VTEAVEAVGTMEVSDVDDVLEADQEARALAREAADRVNKRIPTA